MKVAYAIQNVGGIDFKQDVGDTVPVKQSLLGLQQAGHAVRVLQLRGTRVVQVAPPHFDEPRQISCGVAGSRAFLLAERAARRLQRTLGLRYYAAVDSYRFYLACLRALPGSDLCHEHNGLFCAGAALACARLRMPYVLTFSADLLLERALVGRELTGLHAGTAAAVARFTFRRAAAIVCVSAPARRHLVERWGVDPEKIYVLPNGVDVDRFSPESAQAQAGAVRAAYGLGSAPVITFVGGFQPWHGLEILVESFASVLESAPGARLLLVGDGRARPQVERAIADHRLGDRVIITGMIPQESVPGCLAAADIAVLPYPNLPAELWFSPLKLYEYMAAGKAVVASKAGQIAAVLKDGYNGILVEPGDAAALARALGELLANPDRRRELGRRARAQAVERHSWSNYVRSLEGVYAGALETQGL